jgi:hypothetical protein
VSYNDWDDSFQELFVHTPGMDQPDTDVSYAATLFEVAFTMDEAELDAAGYDQDAVNAIRQEFFDYMGLDWGDFDWDAWREAMGYE